MIEIKGLLFFSDGNIINFLCLGKWNEIDIKINKINFIREDCEKNDRKINKSDNASTFVVWNSNIYLRIKGVCFAEWYWL